VERDLLDDERLEGSELEDMNELEELEDVDELEELEDVDEPLGLRQGFTL
jgi:hypothetical protein